MKLYFLLAFAMTFGSSCFCQTNDANKTSDYSSVIEEFTSEANGNFLFGHGLSTSINEPENDEDALKMGFSTISYDEGKPTIEETEILHSQLVNIHSVEYHAVLFSYKNVKRIALYRPETNGKYYFRTYRL